MPEVRVERRMALNASQVWPLLKDYQHIDAFNPNLSCSSHIDGTPLEGVGAERRCDFKDGRNWIKERVIDWRSGEGYTVEIYDGTMPIRDVRTTLMVTPEGSGTLAMMAIRYTPKLGILGKLLDTLVLRRTMIGLMGRVLAGLETKASATIAEAA